MPPRGSYIGRGRTPEHHGQQREPGLNDSSKTPAAKAETPPGFEDMVRNPFKADPSWTSGNEQIDNWVASVGLDEDVLNKMAMFPMRRRINVAQRNAAEARQLHCVSRNRIFMRLDNAGTVMPQPYGNLVAFTEDGHDAC